MRFFYLVLALLLGFDTAFARDDSLVLNMSPKFYKKRKDAVVNIALVYYGDYYRETDLDRVQKVLETRFEIATNSLLKIRTVAKAILPFKSLLKDYPNYKQPYVIDPERLQRLWYYDNVGAGVLQEIYETGRTSVELQPTMDSIDAILVITGAQFDALGFASGRVGVTENPMEIAWGLPDGGRVEYVTDERVVDELIHELGHTLFIGHASTQCQKPGMTYEETQQCCAVSPAKDDVMGYCRSRARVDETFQHGFSACNLENLRKKIIPSLLAGDAWNVQGLQKCL